MFFLPVFVRSCALASRRSAETPTRSPSALPGHAAQRVFPSPHRPHGCLGPGESRRRVGGMLAAGLKGSPRGGALPAACVSSGVRFQRRALPAACVSSGVRFRGLSLGADSHPPVLVSGVADALPCRPGLAGLACAAASLPGGWAVGAVGAA